MSWSWKLGRVAGIDIHVHVTFLILLAWVGLSYYLERHSWDDAVEGVLFIVALFTIVVLHELGHALTARRFGIRTRDITLLPIGGVARLERMPDQPRQELLVALAGPAVNLALAAILFAVLAGEHLTAMKDLKPGGGDFLSKLLWVNVWMGAFNLLPAFPMDGGRVLRALLAMRMDYARATRIAASIGQSIALLFGLLGLFVNPFLVFIALFVWMGAALESEFHALSPRDPLADAARHTLAGYQQDFPVVDDDRVVGVLTREGLLAGLTRFGPQADVGRAMQTTFETADAGEMAELALARLQQCACRALPVLRDRRLVGIVTMENLGEFVMLHAAMRGRKGGRRFTAARLP
jgi:Zn-dependent protease